MCSSFAIFSDGKLEIVVPSFVHYLEVLEGSDGDKLPGIERFHLFFSVCSLEVWLNDSYKHLHNDLLGWPAFHQSTVHASPLLYDIDKDGVREIALATYNGEVLFFR